MVFSPPPRSSIFYMGPVFTGNDTLIQEKWESFYKDFHSAFERFIHRRFNPNYIYIALPPALHDPRPFSWSGYNLEPNFDYTIDLSKGAELLYHSLDRKHRNAIKKAIENGMQFKIGGKKEYEKILDLMEIRYAEQGKILNTPRKYFLDLYDSYEEMIKVFVILVEDEVVTGSIRLSYRDTLYGWFGNSRPKKHISPSPNNFLFWETIKFAADHGYNNYTTMGAAGNKRIHEFYTERFNPALCMRYTVTKSTSLTKIIEGSYINILKPLRGRIGHLEQISA